jgi:predicted extracellular nuclease
MRFTFLVIFIFILNLNNFGQNELYEGFNPNSRGTNGLRIMFYNVENLFDIKDDSLKNDEEFLPDGIKNWNSYRYWDKQKKIAKVITAAGGWEAPAIVGLCEIENLYVLKNLIYNTPLKKYNYQIIHYESPDNRGIDVAFLYRPDKVSLIDSKPIEVLYESGRPTRDILFAKFLLLNDDTLNAFVNHWPSRWGGQAQSAPKRNRAASVLKVFVDSLIKADSNSNIVIMGDFNDDPDNESIAQHLSASSDTTNNSNLYNLSFNQGTLYYKSSLGGNWNTFDQIIVSKAIFRGNSKVYLKKKKMDVVRADFLIEKNDLGDDIPFRTYLGMRYHGGYSDHLPVFIDLSLKN